MSATSAKHLFLLAAVFASNNDAFMAAFASLVLLYLDFF